MLSEFLYLSILFCKPIDVSTTYPLWVAVAFKSLVLPAPT